MRHTTKMPITIGIGNEDKTIVTYITFEITRGSPAKGPSYASGGQPSEPAEINYLGVEVQVPYEKGNAFLKTIIPAPDWLTHFITESDDVYWACGDDSNWGESTENPNEEYERDPDEHERRSWRD